MTVRERKRAQRMRDRTVIEATATSGRATRHPGATRTPPSPDGRLALAADDRDRTE